VTINDVAASTTSASVKVKVLGRDDVSGVDTVRVSNDGVTWKTYPYSSSGNSVAMEVAWDLTDASAGGNSSTGTKTVYAQFRDRSGKWSATETDSITYGAYTPPPAPTSEYGKAVMADAPTGYWRLGETSGTTAADSAGSTPGTYRNGVTLGRPSLLSSDANAAAGFDGVNDFVSVPFSAGVDASTALTVEAWIKPTALPAAGQFATVATKPESFSLQFYGDQLEFTVIQSGQRRRLRANSGQIVAGQTYHIVATYDGSQQRVYINGALAPSKAQTGNITQNSNGFFIGSWNGSTEFFNGTIDDVAVYKTALSGTRASAHYAAAQASTPPPPPPPPPPPAGYSAAVMADAPTGYWRLGDTSGTQAADSAGTNPGTYRNGVLLGRPSLLTTDAATAQPGSTGSTTSCRSRSRPRWTPRRR
jgi:hypothetical protein